MPIVEKIAQIKDVFDINKQSQALDNIACMMDAKIKTAEYCQEYFNRLDRKRDLL